MEEYRREKVKRNNICSRIGFSFPNINLLSLVSANELTTKLTGDLSDRITTIWEDDGRNSIRLLGKEYRVGHHDPGGRVGRKLRRKRRGWSLGFVVDFPEILLTPSDRNDPYFLLTPSISIGFDSGKGDLGLMWPPDYSSVSSKNESIDILEEESKTKSVWKYWLKITTDLRYSHRESGLGFSDLRIIIKEIVDNKFIEDHFERIMRPYHQCVDLRDVSAVDKICIVTADCQSSTVMSSLFTEVMDSGGIDLIDENESHSVQFYDIEDEIDSTAGIVTGKKSKGNVGFFWCTIEEGATGLFGQRAVDDFLFVAGLSFAKGGQDDLRTLLSQRDYGEQESMSSLVSRGLMNEMVRWY